VEKSSSEVLSGDTVFFYLTGIKAIGGEARVAGESFFDDTKIWESTKPGEVYPYRFPIDIVTARNKDNYVAVGDFIEQYEYAKKWPPKNWTLAFQGNVHRLNEHDYHLISSLLQKN